MIKATSLVLALGLVSHSALAALSSTEQQIVSYLDSTNSQAEALLERSVNINSGTMNFAGVEAVANLLIPEFEALGFTARFESGEKFGRAGHLIAELEGGKGPKMLLIGHLDTVFEPDSPFQTFTRLADNKAMGPGIADMKGGNIIMLQALRALNHSGDLADMNIRVVITGDEELSGDPLSLSKQALVDAAKWADIALGFENGDGNPATANISRRGSVDWTLKVTGVPSHSSQIFQPAIGAGAIYEAARILNAFYEGLRSEELLTFNPGRIIGGTTITHDRASNSGTSFGKNNVVAESAIVTGDIRAISLQQLNRVQQKMTEIVSQNLPQTSAVIEFGDGYPPLAPTEGNKQLLAIYSAVSEDLGQGSVAAVNPLNAGAADVSFTSEYVSMAIDGLGMSGTAGHTVNETGDLDALPAQSKRAALLMLRLKQL
ncbi:M20 family peptidase [Alteromonas aestuariivivens]|uniref:M20 family peptidase n=1 Tax=Alteromonas aestuariivivens TaxID=1938339 RepID=A0A3D8ME97_9ALTE|nr:M20/M25/M40 family metallo-hydrolase [Alteromonas aestuariivivens]RDV29155.1 M20 family peptidase [Alteromonas aestuariivivens]